MILRGDAAELSGRWCAQFPVLPADAERKRAHSGTSMRVRGPGRGHRVGASGPTAGQAPSTSLAPRVLGHLATVGAQRRRLREVHGPDLEVTSDAAHPEPMLRD